MSDSGVLGQKLFIEKTGVLLESIGLPRVVGRCLGALLTAPAQGMAAAEMAGLLHASRAGMSTALKHLTLMGLVEQVPNPGGREKRYRVKPGCWVTLTEQGNSQLAVMRDLATEGLQTLPPGADPTALQEMEDFYALWLELFPKMIEEWHDLQRRKKEGLA